MAEVQRIPLGGPPAGSWLPGVATAVAIFLALAILKPWTPSAPSAAGASARPAPSRAPAATERTGPRGYDPRLFGGREPDPAWELWPAGYVVQFGMAGPVKVHGQDGATPEPGASGDATPAPTAAPSGAGATAAPLPPGVVDLGPADHLVALGINTPLDFRVATVDLQIFRGDDCCLEAVPIVHLPALWESVHFVIIAPEDPSAKGQPGAWDVGQYLLHLASTSGDAREVRFVVRPPLG